MLQQAPRPSDPQTHETPEARFHREYRCFVLSRLEQARGDFRSAMAELESSHVKYAGKVSRFFLHPYVVSRPALDRMARISERLAAVLEKVARRYLEDEETRARFPLDPRLRELILAAPEPPRAAPVLRFDSLCSERELHIVEVNTDGSSGMNDAEELAALFLRLPLMRELTRRFPLELLQMIEPLRLALLDTFRAAGGRAAPDKPVVAIVDWKGIKTEEEFFGLREKFERAGTRTLIVDPRELTFDGKRLRARGTAIDLVYKRVLTAELLTRWDQVRPLLEGYRHGAFVQAGPFLGDVLYDKGVLAFLTDPAQAHLFDAAERDLIARHVPWTRRLEPGRTDYEGRQWDLAELLSHHRQRFVLKPAAAYGGEGVVIGRESSDDTWARSLEAAASRPSVVQEYVDIPTEELVLLEERASFRKKVNLGQFVYAGRFAGLYCRVSDASVINVSAGGAMLPCFVLGEP